jgi:hypothetical protein
MLGFAAGRPDKNPLTGVNHAYGFNGGMQLGLVFFLEGRALHQILPYRK